MEKSVRAYYEQSYSSIQRRGLQGWGNSLLDRWVESEGEWSSTDNLVLEIGASSGEHFKFVRNKASIVRYCALDLAPKISNPDLAKQLEATGEVEFVVGNAEAMPFPDNMFNRSVSMCVLAHVSNPEQVFSELRRVTQKNGSIVIGMPSDPGLLNRFVKNLITYRKMKSEGIRSPRLIYAREHRNSVGNLIELAKEAFCVDSLSIKYMPFRLKSWNLNLAVILVVKLRK